MYIYLYMHICTCIVTSHWASNFRRTNWCTASGALCRAWRQCKMSKWGCNHIHTHVYIYVHVYLYIYVYVYIYVFTYTYMYIYMQGWV